jgi:hypothetical protein
MATGVQVTFDAVDAHRLARFWAAALHYEKEDHSAFIAQLLADGRVQPEDVIFDEGRHAFRDVAACRDPDGQGPRLFFQNVPEPKTAKNRMHLDLNIGRTGGRAAVEAEAARLMELGATVAWISDDRGAHCITMRDPEGNEFCVH